MGASSGHPLLSLYRRVGIVLLRTKQFQIFLSQNEFIEAWQRQILPIRHVTRGAHGAKQPLTLFSPPPTQMCWT